MIDLRNIAANLEAGPDGLWSARTRSAVDYPDEGNAFCFQIEDHSFWFRHRNACILDLVSRFPPPGAIFDIGGGNGYVARALVEAGLLAVVVEPGLTGARNAQSRGLAPVVWAALDDAGFHPGALPAVGLFDVLEHMADDAGVMRQLAGLLQPGGRLYLSVPAYEWLWSTEDDLGGHYRRYTRRSLHRVVEGAGLDVEFSSYAFWPLPLPILILRSIPSRLGWRPPARLDTIRSELQPEEGLAVKALAMLLDLERWWLRRGGAVPFGGSCMLVARRAP
ncbi:MAG: class I SAM-dependent methyltransferase [Acidobacteria bacterium]|nr:class I SAM-dependent methyltransferase [Acidobacteriota bacterium]